MPTPPNIRFSVTPRRDDVWDSFGKGFGYRPLVNPRRRCHEVIVAGAQATILSLSKSGQVREPTTAAATPHFFGC
jgi:hypothetical protein